MLAEYAVWTGRFQPTHVGHLAILKYSLAAIDAPHLLAIVSDSGTHGFRTPYEALAAEAYSPARNPFTEWERYRLMSLALKSLRDGERVEVIIVPRHDRDWEGIKAFYPPRRFICLTDKDDFESAKSELWSGRGEQVRVFRTRDIPGFATGTQIRRSIAGGSDWHAFLPETSWEYFEDIDGPNRLLGRDQA